MKRWEYRVEKLHTKGFAGGILETEALANLLNQLGAEGWELVSCFTTAQVYGMTREVIALLKRESNQQHG